MPGTPKRGAATLVTIVRGRWDVVGVVALGGAIGGAARWLVNASLPHVMGTFPWSTLIENVTGSLLLGVLLVYVLEVWRPGRYVRAFLGTGVLGGYTTFSTFSTDILALARGHEGAQALAYLVGSLVGGLLAAWAGMMIARVLVVRPGTVERGV